MMSTKDECMCVSTVLCVMYEWWMWGEEGKRRNLALAYSHQKVPRVLYPQPTHELPSTVHKPSQHALGFGI